MKCIKIFNRKDNHKRHIQSCIKTDDNRFLCIKCKRSYSSQYNLNKHKKKNKCVVNVEEEKAEILRKEMKLTSEQYLEKLESGRMISNILQTDQTIIEASLDNVKKENLLLFQKSSSIVDEDVKLRAWQFKLMDYLNSPSDRDIIWVRGLRGDEGKTFFQKYIYALYGSRRVCKLELCRKSENIYYVLSRQSLTCKDIFLFNVSKSNNTA